MLGNQWFPRKFSLDPILVKNLSHSNPVLRRTIPQTELGHILGSHSGYSGRFIKYSWGDGIALPTAEKIAGIIYMHIFHGASR